MGYFVIAPDGNEYGPADLVTLKQWVSENRLYPTTQLKDEQTGQIIAAGTIPNLFSSQVQAPAPVVAPPYASSPASNYQMPQMQVDDSGMFWNSVIRSGLALLFFFVLRGIGIIFAGYAVYYAVQCFQLRGKKGPYALAISIVVLVIIGIGWLLRGMGTAV